MVVRKFELFIYRSLKITVILVQKSSDHEVTQADKLDVNNYLGQTVPYFVKFP